MTRRDYELLSEVVKSCLGEIPADMGEDTAIMVRLAVHFVAEHLAYRLTLDNPRFDRDRFLRDCGFTDED